MQDLMAKLERLNEELYDSNNDKGLHLMECFISAAFRDITFAPRFITADAQAFIAKQRTLIGGGFEGARDAEIIEKIAQWVGEMA